MIRKRIFTAAIAALMVVACNKSYIETTADGDQIMTFTVNVPTSMTKTASVTEAQEETINNLQVFVFNPADGYKLETYEKTTEGASVNISCSSGTKRIVAVVNAPDMNDVMTLDALKEKEIRLASLSHDSLIMMGEKDVTDGEMKTSVTIDVTRLVSKITLNSVKVDFKAGAYNSVEVTKIFLLNAVGHRKMASLIDTPTLWYNKMVYESDSPAVLSDKLTGVSVSRDNEYKTPHSFYTFANPVATDVQGGEWSVRKTRLVVEAKIGESTYYYPMTFDNISQNFSYTVDLIIERPGALTPDCEIEKQAATFNVAVVDWNSQEPIVETI